MLERSEDGWTFKRGGLPTVNIQRDRISRGKPGDRSFVATCDEYEWSFIVNAGRVYEGARLRHGKPNFRGYFPDPVFRAFNAAMMAVCRIVRPEQLQSAAYARGNPPD